MKFTKNKFVLVCAALLLLAVPLCAVFLAGNAERTVVNGYDTASSVSVKTVEKGQVYSFRFTAEEAFDGIRLGLRNVGGVNEARIALYPAKDSIADTLGGNATVTATVTEEGGEWVYFPTQSAGTYVVSVTAEKGSIGILAAVEDTLGYVDCFLGETDIEDFDPAMQVSFTAKSASYFTAATTAPASGTSQTLDSTDPKYTVKPGTWVFTDDLGRVSLTNEDVGDPKTGKSTVMFFWDWHIDDRLNKTPKNVQKLMEAHPEIKNNYNSTYWGAAGSTAYFWDEPIYGYYSSADKWVIRKQGELLANADIDAIIFDNTNGSFTWMSAYSVIYETYDTMQKSGVDVPKISFMFPFSAGSHSQSQINTVYNHIYYGGRYSNLWFYVGGKPFIMGYADGVSSTIQNFFTIRKGHGTYTASTSSAAGSTYWGWLNIYPQPVFGANTSIKQMTVSVAQNYTYAKLTGISYPITAMNGEKIMGRSYTKTYGDLYNGTTCADGTSSLYGYNFAEQFNYAISKNPNYILITGWNEWWAGRQVVWPSESGYNSTNNALPDTFNDEYSRDIEPTKGKLKDNYYYQLVNFVRQYKGTEAIEKAGAAQSIDIYGDLSQWNGVTPYFAAYQDNIGNRVATGYAGKLYTEKSGRNDIIGAQMERDGNYLYILVECKSDITAYNGGRWMNVYLDTNQSNQGWETFDYVINKTAPTATTAYVERFTGNDTYTTETVGEVAYNVDGRFLTIKIPKSMLGISGNDFTVNFAVTDNVHDEKDTTTFSGDIMNFYISGDVAPGGRFKYSYISTSSAATSGMTELQKTLLYAWYEEDYSEAGGLRAKRLTDISDVTFDMTSTGWTRAAVVYIPNRTYTDEEVTLFTSGASDGAWNTAIRYSLVTGKVSSLNSTLFPEANQTATAKTARGWVKVTETFDGTTQKVWIDGTLAYTATAANTTAGKACLTASAASVRLSGANVASTSDASGAAGGMYAECGVIVWCEIGYARCIAASAMPNLLALLPNPEEKDPTDLYYNYDAVTAGRWYAYDYTADGGSTSTSRAPVTFENAKDLGAGFTKEAVYNIPADRTYVSGDKLLIFGMKDTPATGVATITTGIAYDLGTGFVELSDASAFTVKTQLSRKVTGQVHFIQTYAGGEIRVYLNGEEVLRATADVDLSACLMAESQVQIFLNVYAAYEAKRTSYVNQYTAYGVALMYTRGYEYPIDAAGSVRMYDTFASTLTDDDDEDLTALLAASWYDLGLAGTEGKKTSAITSPASMSAWTRETVLYIPDTAFASDVYVGVAEGYRTDDGLWIANIKYQPSTGTVSSTSTGVFPLKGTQKTAVKASGYVHFVEVFDGTTQKVWVNGTLAYTATVSSAVNPFSVLPTSVLTGGYAGVGTLAADAADVATAYGITTVYAKGYTLAADEKVAKLLYNAYIK